MSEAIKPTPGPWSRGYSVNGACCVWFDGHTEPHADMGENSTWIDCETVGNATLIADAGNVFHETGLTPRQLVQQRDALAAALEGCVQDLRDVTSHFHVHPQSVLGKNLAKASAALALVKGAKP